MSANTQALRAAFPHTIPVLTGFTILGAAYGILMNSKGYGVEWSVFLSIFALAGSAQYVAIGLLTTVFDPIYALMLTVIINARHIFYGISMLDKYKDTGKFKYYLIYGLCDETFSIIHTAEPPAGVDRNLFMFFITLLNHSYWVGGTLLGGLIGDFIPLNTQGMDFALTALFIAIFVNQWKNRQRPAATVEDTSTICEDIGEKEEDEVSNKTRRQVSLIGLCTSVACLAIFGPENFIIPAMLAIIAVLTILQKKLGKEKSC